MKRIRGYHLLFGLSLLALGALGSWWVVFFLRAVDQEKRLELGELTHVTVVTALMLGQRDEPPPVGAKLSGRVPLEVVRSADRQKGDLFSALVPRHPEVGVRPQQRLLQAIDDKIYRRRLMLLGEGGMLFVLLVVCTYMLYHLVRSERRQMRRMELFLSTITHEMKTPLAGIKSMLQTFAAGRVPTDQQDMLFAMGLKESERLEHMIENFLLAGRLRNQRYEVYNEAIKLRALLLGFIDHRRQYLVGRPEAVEFVWDAEPEDLNVFCDPNALHVVLENLTDNALKYGGEKPVVTLRVAKHADEIALSVEDRGIGFDPALTERLFVPFRRAMDPRESVQHGTGLGLSIAKALAERMGGRLEAHSDGPGKGSRFTLTLKESQS